MDPLISTFFREEGWLAAHNHVLTPADALDYFVLSPFYCATDSINEVARLGALSADALKLLAGREYVVVRNPACEPWGLIVIEQRERKPSGEFTVSGVYYVLHGTIYCAPDLHSLLTSRVERCAFHVEQAALALQFEHETRGRLATEQQVAIRRAPLTGSEATLASAGSSHIEDVLRGMDR